MSIPIHPLVLFVLVFGAFFLGMFARSLYPAVPHDHINFTTHGEHHE